MAIQGIIKGGDVLHNARLIVHDYGFRVFWRCVIAACHPHRNTTFLGCVYHQRRGDCRTRIPAPPV